MDGFRFVAAEGTSQSRPGWMDLSSTWLKEKRRCGGVRSGWKRGGEGLAGVCLAAAAQDSRGLFGLDPHKPYQVWQHQRNLASILIAAKIGVHNANDKLSTSSFANGSHLPAKILAARMAIVLVQWRYQISSIKC